jgi:hypothetical protein
MCSFPVSASMSFALAVWVISFIDGKHPFKSSLNLVSTFRIMCFSLITVARKIHG